VTTGSSDEPSALSFSLSLAAVIASQVPSIEQTSDGRPAVVKSTKGAAPTIYGADLLRLWAASTDYTSAVSIGSGIVAKALDGRNKLRNSLRFLLGVLHDFSHARDAGACARLCGGFLQPPRNSANIFPNHRTHSTHIPCQMSKSSCIFSPRARHGFFSVRVSATF
jgi:hypothetical protein